MLHRNWTRALSGLVMAFGLSLVLIGTTFAWEARLAGEPPALGNTYGVFAWVGDEGGLHLRTVALRDYDHQFTGTIVTDGQIYGVTSQSSGGDDSVTLSPNHKTLTFVFHTFDGQDGVDYWISGGSYQSVSAFEWGKRMEATNIYLGANGAHPEFNPFTDSR